MKLLVVDDEKMIRQLIAKYAVFDGYEVAEAENGMQAVEMARAGGYDLIIMDIMMPGAGRLFGCQGNSKDQRRTHHFPFRKGRGVRPHSRL